MLQFWAALLCTGRPRLHALFACGRRPFCKRADGRRPMAPTYRRTMCILVRSTLTQFSAFRITLLRVEIGFRVCWFCPRDWVGPTKSGGQVASTTVGDPVGKPPSGCQLPTPRGQCSHGLYYRFSTSLLRQMSTFSNIFSSCFALDVRIRS